MTNQNTNNQQSINTDFFIGGRYLRQSDLSEPITATINAAWTERFKNEPKPKLIIGFHENDIKPLILNTTNTLVLRAMFGSKDAIDFRGPVTLYVEPEVYVGSERKGGIRVKPIQPPAVAEAPQVERQPQQTQQQQEPQAHQYPNGAAAEGRIRRYEGDTY